MADLYVQRGAGGAIIGLFAGPQPGIATEAIDAAHPDAAAFRARPDPAPRDVAAELDALAAKVARAEAAEAALIEKAIVTKGEIDAKLPVREAGEIKG